MISVSAGSWKQSPSYTEERLQRQSKHYPAAFLKFIKVDLRMSIFISFNAKSKAFYRWTSWNWERGTWGKDRGLELPQGNSANLTIVSILRTSFPVLLRPTNLPLVCVLKDLYFPISFVSFMGGEDGWWKGNGKEYKPAVCTDNVTQINIKSITDKGQKTPTRL